MEELRQEEIAEAVKEATEEMVEERDRYRADVAVLLRDRMGLSKLVVRLEADAERLAAGLDGIWRKVARCIELTIVPVDVTGFIAEIEADARTALAAHDAAEKGEG
jgi:hypothetical protein